MSNLVIVGGGAAGIELATLLGKQFKSSPDTQVILVEPETHHYWKPRYHEVAAGTFDAELDTICYFTHGASRGYRHCQARMQDIDRQNRQLKLSHNDGSTSTLNYDYLVIAIGAVSNDFATQGALQHCLFLDTAEQARAGWFQVSQLLRSGGERNINIVGAGATGVELAAELARQSEKLQHHPHAARLNIRLIEAAPRVLPNSPEKMSAKVAQRLQQFGIQVLTNTRIQSVSDAGMMTDTGEDLAADLQFWAAGIKAPDWLKDIAGLESNRANQLVVQQTLQTTRDDRIFALGDCAAIPMPQEDGSLAQVPPKAQAANRAALHLAKTLPAYIQGQPLLPFVFKDAGMFVALGHGYAVSTMLNNKLILQGSMMRRMYDTIFRLHQQTVSGMVTVSRLMISKRLKRALKPGNL